jgi:hypothetical protein
LSHCASCASLIRYSDAFLCSWYSCSSIGTCPDLFIQYLVVMLRYVLAAWWNESTVGNEC